MSWPRVGHASANDVYYDRPGATQMMTLAVQNGLVSGNVDIDTTTLQAGRPASERTLQSDKDLTDYITNELQVAAANASNIIFLFQQHSRAPLDTTPDGLDALLCKLDAFPAVAKLFHAFVPEESDSYLGRALVHHESNTATTSPSELCMLLKYMTRNTRDPTGSRTNSWSIRNLGVYQKHDASTNTTTVLLINVSEALGIRTKQCLQPPSGSFGLHEHWTRMPLLVIGTLSANWLSFTADLHQDVAQLATDSAFTNPDRPQTGEINVHSLEQCTTLLDKLQQATHALQCNLTILDALRLHAESRRNDPAPPTATSEQIYAAFFAGLADAARELAFTKAQLELIQNRLDRTTGVVRDLVSLRSTRTIEKLTVRSMVEARTVRLIAIVSLLFIPPTFTTVSLGLRGVFGAAVAAGPMASDEEALLTHTRVQSFIQADMVHPFVDGLPRLNTDHDLWFWFAITFPLMLITLGGWLYWDWRTTRKMSRELDWKV